MKMDDAMQKRKHEDENGAGLAVEGTGDDDAVNARLSKRLRWDDEAGPNRPCFLEPRAPSSTERGFPTPIQPPTSVKDKESQIPDLEAAPQRESDKTATQTDLAELQPNTSLAETESDANEQKIRKNKFVVTKLKEVAKAITEKTEVLRLRVIETESEIEDREVRKKKFLTTALGQLTDGVAENADVLKGAVGVLRDQLDVAETESDTHE
ncbi:hypothetical protein HDU76_000641 [Blyttiomyces sp. JEL0837]|nr:hypothetical protein HDU76_000641 [Blyttiomyces sp. JEL0837]